MVIHRGTSARIVGKLKATDYRRIPMDVQKVEVACDGIYRVVVAVPPVSTYTSRLANDTEVASSISSKFSNVLRYLPNSMTATETASVFTLFVKGNVPVMTKETASTRPMVEIAANVFKDDDDCIWSLSEDASGNPIYTRSDIGDFAEILNAARSANIVTASLEVATAELFKAGQVVAFYDVASENRRVGIAVTDREVFVPDADNIVTVLPTMVLAATDDSLKVNLTGIGSKAGVLDYMRAIYGKNSEFFAGLKRLVNQNLAV